MTRYRIVCTDQEPQNTPHDAAHIVAVGIGTEPNRATDRLTISDVYARMDRGDEFYTEGVQSRKQASVHKYGCKTCGFATIRSSADSVQDNNLDKIRPCKWK